MSIGMTHILVSIDSTGYRVYCLLNMRTQTLSSYGDGWTVHFQKRAEEPILVLLWGTKLYSTEHPGISISMSFSDLIVWVQLVCLIFWRNSGISASSSGSFPPTSGSGATWYLTTLCPLTFSGRVAGRECRREKICKKRSLAFPIFCRDSKSENWSVQGFFCHWYLLKYSNCLQQSNLFAMLWFCRLSSRNGAKTWERRRCTTTPYFQLLFLGIELWHKKGETITSR